jgi:YfiH family protein
MILKEKNGTKYYTFPNLSNDPRIWHGIFTRHGGCSRKPFKSLNIGNGLGDQPDAVRKNRKRISQCVGENDIVYVDQNHGAEILVFRKDNETGTPIASPVLNVGDAMITNVPKKYLAIQVADCQSVFLYDPMRQVLANIHVGWRGTVKNIIGLTIERMATKFKTFPGNIQAGVGPSLGPCCAEYRNYREEIPERFWKYKDRHHRFDFWSVTADQLTAAGVLRKNICNSGMCTKCNTDLFFSYRSEGVTGRFAAVIGLV